MEVSLQRQRTGAGAEQAADAAAASCSSAGLDMPAKVLACRLEMGAPARRARPLGHSASLTAVPSVSSVVSVWHGSHTALCQRGGWIWSYFSVTNGLKWSQIRGRSETN